MTINEFDEKYRNLRAKDKIEVTCNCGDSRTICKEKAKENLLKHGYFKCRKCSMTQWHENVGLSEESKKKIGEKNKGLKMTEEEKQHLSKVKKEIYQTEEGEKIKQKISETVTQAWKDRKNN